ncbi:MAG: DUF2795 domain-containing protein [Myxococcaceae bacterium]
MDENVEAGVDRALATMRPLDEDLSKALLGAIFPLDRSEIVAIARENEAPGTLLTLLSSLQDGPFHSLRELQDAVTTS